MDIRPPEGGSTPSLGAVPPEPDLPETAQPVAAPAPPVQWEPPATPVAAEVAPGLAYAGAIVRIAAWWIDVFVLAIALGFVGGVLGAIFRADEVAASIASTILGLAFDLVYFVGLWTSSYRATLGMRIFRLQIGNASDGRTLTPGQAVRRWIAMGFPLSLLGIVPSLLALSVVLQFGWLVILAISVATGPTKRGLHDRFAGSAVAQPAGASNAAAIACFGLIVLFALVPVLLIILLILLDGQIETILSGIGSSI